MMTPQSNITCHDTMHKKKCKDNFLNCWKWIQIQGVNPNTGEELNDWKCADAWMPILTLENSSQQRQSGAALESFRNEMVRATEASHQILISAAQQPTTLMVDKK